MRGNVLVGVLAADDRRREDGVGRGEAGGDDERGEEVEAGNEGVDEAC